MHAVVTHDQDFRKICQRLLNEGQSGRVIPAAGNWLLDNYSVLRAQARELREALSRRFWARLGGDRSGVDKEQPRIYVLATELVRRDRAQITPASLRQFFGQAQADGGELCLAELWAIQPVVKLALLDCVNERASGSALDAAETEEWIKNAITSLRAIDQLAWNDFVESLSAVEQVLRTDPAGVYARMDFDTRDSYRQAVEKLAGKGPVAERARREVEIAHDVVRQAASGGQHVGYYLVGPGETRLPRVRRPRLIYFGGMALLVAALLWLVAYLLQDAPWWLLALLMVPLSQLALGILHPLVNRLVGPRLLPRLDFSRGVADDCRTFVVIPTLLLSRGGITALLERIEIHYLANRDPKLLFGLLTDFADAKQQHTEKDELANLCAEGIRALNHRYGEGGRGPFYLFHRERLFNASEGVWMGRERKRGKLDDFNEYLLGRGDPFTLKEGDLEGIGDIRYILTLDTDTQLPRESARQLIATMAHPLNRPVLDSSRVVRQGYALLQPRVSVSMESARKSRLANLYSGQTGLDPYTKAVSDVYQDLFGQASYTGKGIYDLAAFAEATRGRFPDNTLLSHDLIEGEHVRVGLVTDVEVIDDFPATYESFCKRKHRWVRGDWQIALWLFFRVPDAEWRYRPNPLAGLSRWKIFDNLRRSLFELSLTLFFIAGLFTDASLRCDMILAAILLFPAFAQAFFSLLRFPPVRFWRVFLREVVSQFARTIADGVVQLTFLLHQALLMIDAIGRTLVRRMITHRKLLEWESAAQAESGGGKLSWVTIYLFACPVVATLVAFVATREDNGSGWLPMLTMALWAASPLAAEFVSGSSLTFKSKRTPVDLQFLREVSLRTWRFFLDFGTEEDHWLVPDNIQEDPWAVAHRSSPTNMGLQVIANVAARDFGYLTHIELAARLRDLLGTLNKLERDRGHFYNWYDTETLRPLAPRYISSVDSGNLAASLITIKQSCVEVLDTPLIGRHELDGLRDGCQLLRQSLPSAGRTGPIMRQLDAFSQQLECKPGGLYHWEGLLSELLKLSAGLIENTEWLSEHWKSRNRQTLDESVYWARFLKQRLEAMLASVATFAPWLAGRLEEEVRMLASDARMHDLMADLSVVPSLQALPAHYDAIEARIESLLSGPLSAGTSRVFEELREAFGPARYQAEALLESFRRTEANARLLFHEMDFRFLLNPERMLMRIGFDVETGQTDDSHYDLLASEARTGVFLAVAKGDFPREAWFRLGRRLCSYRGHRTLLSWSGTMFEYLMPALFLRTFEDSLLGESLAGAVRIQQLYCRTKRVPWGVSEAAHSERDAARNYQYRAFGVPVMGLKRMEPRELVVAPYATLLALPVDPHGATENLRNMRDRGWLGKYGFYESVDYTGRDAVVIRAFMAHHQGMAFTALANALLDHPMPRRFHLEPMVQATELLLQERLPVIYDESPVEESLAPRASEGVPAVAVGQES